MKCYASDYCQKDKSSCSDVCGGYRVLRALYNLSRIPERYRYRHINDLDEVKHLMDVSLKQKAYIENLEAELNECKMLNNQLMSDLDADEGLAEICVNEFIADTIKAVKDAGVKKITVEF